MLGAFPLALPEVRGQDPDDRKDLQTTSEHEEAEEGLGERARSCYVRGIFADTRAGIADRGAGDTDARYKAIVVKHEKGSPEKDQSHIEHTEG